MSARSPREGRPGKALLTKTPTHRSTLCSRHPKQGNYWAWEWNGTAITWDTNGCGQSPNILFFYRLVNQPYGTQPVTMSQTVTTVPGQVYRLQFWQGAYVGVCFGAPRRTDGTFRRFNAGIDRSHLTFLPPFSSLATIYTSEGPAQDWPRTGVAAIDITGYDRCVRNERALVGVIAFTLT